MLEVPFNGTACDSRDDAAAGAGEALRFWTLGSGSKGNATLFLHRGVGLLVDAGFELPELVQRIRRAGVAPADIEHVVLTHGHRDHVLGAAHGARVYGWRLWGTLGTVWRWRALREVPLLPFATGDVFDAAPVRIATAPTPHDIDDSSAIVVEAAGARVGVCTDLGEAPPGVRALLAGCDALVVESNYDPEMLARGPYADDVKRRVAGPHGHLSNDRAAALARDVVSERTAAVVLAHISRHNNTPALAVETMRAALAGSVFRGVVVPAPQDEVLGPIVIATARTRARQGRREWRPRFIARRAGDTLRHMPRLDTSTPLDHEDPVARIATDREAALVAWLQSETASGVVVGFSGGVDSVYLAAIALEALGPEHVLAVTGRSASYPAEQWETARAVVVRLGLPHLELDTREIDDPRYVENPTNRCYFCKSELWSRLQPIAAQRGMTLVDGTNADDGTDHRPGAAAARLAGVRSPLAEVGLTKAEIRALSRARGLPTADQPSSPCLASRIPYGTTVTPERLARIEHAERALRELGVVGDLRVRFHGELARVELSRSELDRWLSPAAAGRLRDAVRGAGFRRVSVDLRGFRSGSLNVLSGVVAE